MTEAEHYPRTPGHYWARWRVASPGTLEGDEQTPSDTWEVVQVNDNNGEPGELEELSVSVPGVQKTQWRNQFQWGPRVPDYKS